MSEITNQYRFLAAVVLECKTPLIIGSGNKTIKTDSQINIDCNGLPYIPGSTLTGILRHTFEERFLNGYDYDNLFGYIQGKNGSGSRVIVTEAKILDQDGEVVDGLQDKDIWNQKRIDYFDNFKALPIRQHAKIGHQGTTLDGGKFDEEIIFKGTRFCFELELVSDNADDEKFFKKALDIIACETFSVGGKTNSGFGKMKAEIIKYKGLDFSKDCQFDLYLGKSAKIDYKWSTFEDYKPENIDNGYTKYALDLMPEDFIFFSSGFGNGRADNTSVKEKFITWDHNDKAQFIEAKNTVLIPATSVKGAIAHRTAYHYNKLKKFFADKGTNFDKVTGKNNVAVKTLFGTEGEKDEHGKLKNKRKGIVVFSDVLQVKKTTTQDKVFNHVAIDRFTGGAIDGALFNGEYLYAKDEKIMLEIFVDESKITEDKDDIIKAFELALADVKKGMLPLGGGVTKGNGTFSGKLTKNGKEIYGEN